MLWVKTIVELVMGKGGPLNVPRKLAKHGYKHLVLQHLSHLMSS